MTLSAWQREGDLGTLDEAFRLQTSRHSVELVMLPVTDPGAAAPFYQMLGLTLAGGDPKDELVLEKPGFQLVLVRSDKLDPDDGRPRFVMNVSIDVLEAVWARDTRDERTLPGPTLSSEGAFEYRTRDPSGNRVRLLAYLPADGGG